MARWTVSSFQRQTRPGSGSAFPQKCRSDTGTAHGFLRRTLARIQETHAHRASVQQPGLNVCLQRGCDPLRRAQSHEVQQLWLRAPRRSQPRRKQAPFSPDRPQRSCADSPAMRTCGTRRRSGDSRRSALVLPRQLSLMPWKIFPSRSRTGRRVGLAPPVPRPEWDHP